jgi:hypothetical protein
MSVAKASKKKGMPTETSKAPKLARRAEEAERSWKETLSAGERRAVSVNHQAQDAEQVRIRYALAAETEDGVDRHIKRRIDERRTLVRDKERTRNRGRNRTMKNVPAGIDPVPLVLRKVDGELQFVRAKEGEKLLFKADAALLTAAADKREVTPDLAVRAQALRAVLDVRTMNEVEGGRLNCFLPPEMVEVVDYASSRLAGLWITILFRLLDDAISTSHGIHRGRLDGASQPEFWSRAPRSAPDILDALQEELAPYGILAPLPAYVTVDVIKWALGRYTRGRGNTSKLSVDKLRALLMDPGALAAAMAGPRSRRK